MRRNVFALLLCLLAPFAAAATTSGIVSMSNGGGPLADARVTVRRAQTPLERRLNVLGMTQAPAPLASTITDAKGVFTFEKLDGLLVIDVERDGYAPASDYVHAGSTDVVFDLKRAEARKGRVTAEGKPVANARIFAMWGISVMLVARTDERGTYAIPAPSGWCDSLVIVHPDFAPQMILVKSARSPLDATLNKGVSVTGKVIDAAQKPVPNARVIADDWSITTTAADGTFTFAHLTTKPAQLEASAGDAFGRQNVGKESTVIVITQRPVIRGQARDADKRPLAGLIVTAYSTVPRYTSTTYFRITVSDEHGDFRFDHCEDTTYQVYPRVTADFEIDTVSAHSGAKDVILIAKAVNSLKGIVADEQHHPIVGATVQLTVAGVPLIYGLNQTERAPSARTGADGRFRLPQAAVEMLSHTSRPRLQASRQGYAVGVSDDIVRFDRDITITLPAGVPVEGTVVDGNGNAVPHAGLIIMQGSMGSVAAPLDAVLAQGSMSPFIESDDAGRFSLRLNPAMHDFGVYKEDMGVARVGSVDVKAGMQPLKFVLHAGVALRGHVVREDGSIVKGGEIKASGGDLSYGTATVEEDGSFTIDALSSGTYELQYARADGEQAQMSAVAPADDVVVKLPAIGKVHGRVIDAETRLPLKEYQVRYSYFREIDPNEGADDFSADLPAGDAELSAGANGYLQSEQTVSVIAGKTTEVTFALTPGRPVSGRVTAAGGGPIESAAISDSSDWYASTDADGTFEGVVSRDALELTVAANGYVAKTIDVAAGTSPVNLDVALSRGRSVRGRVLTAEGTPLAAAVITASSATLTSQNATAEADGTFTISGLDDGKYQFAARKESDTSESLEVDVTRTAEIVLRMKSSAGTGSIHGVIKGFAGSNWMMAAVMAGERYGMAERDGTFRIEQVPAGEVKVRAMVQGSNQTTIATTPITVTVTPGSDVAADLDLHIEQIVHGTVIEDGVPATGRLVQFMTNEGRSVATTDAKGEYTVAGVQPGMTYAIGVRSGNRTFTTRRTINSDRVDIRIEWTRIEGRVIDSSGAAVVGADVQLATANDPETSESARTNANGAFTLSLAQTNAVVVTVEKEGYATSMQQITPSAAPLVITLSKTDGLAVRLVNALTGANLDGYAVALDEAGRQVARASDTQKDGTLRLPVAAGNYRIAVSVNGFGSQSARTAVPRDGEMRFALTPGGKLVVNTDRASNDVIKLVLPSGEEYVRCQCNGIAAIHLTGVKTIIENVAAGSYTMQVLDERGAVKGTNAVTVTEGQTTEITIHVPE